MSHAATDLILKAIRDSDFRDLLFSNPERARSGYELTPAEAEALRNLDRKTFDSAVAQIDRETLSCIRRGGPEIADLRIQSLALPVAQNTRR